MKNVLNFGGCLVGKGCPCFIVAEIGQNHQGSLDLAKELIVKAKEAGADCVKFQKSCLKEKFTESALKRPYESENSFGKTYGEHKEFLEFSIEEFKELQEFSSKIGILFTASAMDLESFKQLESLNVPFIKIGSGDADNVQMLRYAAKQKIPIVISTGMQNLSSIKNITSILKDQNYALLHCVSSYPTMPSDVNLRMIEIYKDMLPEGVIGYSGHEIGVQISVAAVLLGAKIIERHITLDQYLKGSDHKASLTPCELKKMVNYIRKAEKFNNSEIIEEVISMIIDKNELFKHVELNKALKEVNINDKKLMNCEKPCHEKLGKSLVFAKMLEKRHLIDDDDVAIKVSEPKGLSPILYNQIIGKKLTKNVNFEEPIQIDSYE